MPATQVNDSNPVLSNGLFDLLPFVIVTDEILSYVDYDTLFFSFSKVNKHFRNTLNDWAFINKVTKQNNIFEVVLLDEFKKKLTTPESKYHTIIKPCLTVNQSFKKLRSQGVVFSDKVFVQKKFEEDQLSCEEEDHQENDDADQEEEEDYEKQSCEEEDDEEKDDHEKQCEDEDQSENEEEKHEEDQEPAENDEEEDEDMDQVKVYKPNINQLRTAIQTVHKSLKKQYPVFLQQLGYLCSYIGSSGDCFVNAVSPYGLNDPNFKKYFDQNFLFPFTCFDLAGHGEGGEIDGTVILTNEPTEYGKFHLVFTEEGADGTDDITEKQRKSTENCSAVTFLTRALETIAEVDYNDPTELAEIEWRSPL